MIEKTYFKKIFNILLISLLLLCVFSYSNEDIKINNQSLSEQQSVEQGINIEEEDLPDLGDINDKSVIANSQGGNEVSKILKLDVLTNIEELKNTNLYIGQHITIDYKLILFDNAQIVYTEFSPSVNSIEYVQSEKKDPIELAKKGEWIKKDDGYHISFTFKVNAKKFTIPSLVVHVRNDFLTDKDQSDGIDMSALSLYSNKGFCGVVASNLRIINTNIQNYDDNYNAIAIDLEAKNSNLEDLKLRDVEFQDLAQDGEFSTDISSATLLLKLPKSLDRVSFSYFNIDSKKFEELSVQNVVNVADSIDNVSPKSTFFSITNVIIISLTTILIALTILLRSYLAGIITIIILIVFAYNMLSKTHKITTISGAKLTIQPTYTSTVLLTIPNPVKIQAMDKKNGYYKVNINSKIGWINENDTQ